MATILVALDYSDCAANVLSEAVRFARAFRARLLLLHACEAPRGLPLNALVQPDATRPSRPVLDVLRDDADAHLAPMLTRVRDAGVRCDLRVAFGRPSEVILDVAAGERAAMILMGTHGRAGAALATFGSVAEEVIRQADVPVVTVRTRHHAGCAAKSCATCEQGRSPLEARLDAERTR